MLEEIAKTPSPLGEGGAKRRVRGFPFPFFCAAILLLFLSIATTYATTVERLTLEDLSKRAHSIVMGKVRASHVAWDATGKIILTTYTIDVQESLKGQPASTVELTTVGGRIGNTILHVAGMPAFADGESAVIFIEQSGRYSTVLGLSQGKFTVANGEVRNATAGLSFPGGQHPGDTRMPLATFRKQIRAMLDRRP